MRLKTLSAPLIFMYWLSMPCDRRDLQSLARILSLMLLTFPTDAQPYVTPGMVTLLCVLRLKYLRSAPIPFRTGAHSKDDGSNWPEFILSCVLVALNGD